MHPMARQAGKGVRFNVAGLGEAKKALDALPGVVAKKVLRKAIRQAMRPVKSAVEANAPVGETGAIRSAVKIRVPKKRRRNVIAIDVQIGKGDFTGDTYYAAMREFGHKIRRTPRGPVVGVAEGTHYMERAAKSEEDGAKAEVVRLIKAGLPAAIREAKKLGKGK